MKQQMMNARPRTAWVAIFVFAGACNSVLGTDALRADGCPSVGTLDCEDVVTPKICRADGQWEVLAPCVDQACEAGQCVGNCAPSFRQCEDNTPEVCNKTGQWIREAKCHGKTCLDGICQGICERGIQSCEANAQKKCGDDGQWVLGTTCMQQTCLDGDCIGVCAPSERSCAGNTPQTCGATGQWADDSPCDNQTCVNGVCQGVCVVGAKTCMGLNSPFVCNDQGDWSAVPMCPFGQTCLNGECVGECAPGRRCVDNIVQFCDIYGKWQYDSDCTAPDRCIAGECVSDLPLCGDLDLRCNGNILESCVSIFDYWIEAQNCSQIQKTCWQGTCAGVCVKGNARCQVDAKTPEICNEQGQWQAQPPCAGACVAGACP
jgi:hypothetical protein